MLQISQLKRNPNVISEVVTVIDNALVAKKRCYVILPFRWLQAGLLEISSTSYCATIFPIVNDNNEYSVSNVCTKMEITPSSIEMIKHEGMDHYVFVFDKGSVISPDINLVMDDTYSYNIYDELIQKAKAPWFLNYKDVGKIMATSKSHSGVTLAGTNAIFELITATLSRNHDMSKQYRQVVNSLELDELNRHVRQGVPLNSVVYATSNKMNKLMGGYIEDGLTSALTEEESPTSGVEQLLRKK